MTPGNSINTVPTRTIYAISLATSLAIGLVAEAVHAREVYAIDQARAFSVARQLLSIDGTRRGKVPIPSVACIDGETKGIRGTFKFKKRSYTQEILVLPVTGRARTGATISGFLFEIRGDTVPNHRSIAQTLSQLNNLLAKHRVEVTYASRSQYDDYGYGTRHKLDEIKEHWDIETLLQLTDQCIVPREEFAALIRNAPTGGGGAINLGKVRKLPNGAMDNIRMADKYFYNRNFAVTSDNANTDAGYRARLYDEVIKAFISTAETGIADDEIAAYRRYLTNVSRGRGIGMTMVRKISSDFAEKIVASWYLHQRLFKAEPGSVIFEEGWLPINPYLALLRDYEGQGRIRFPDSAARERVFSYYSGMLEQDITTPILAALYYEAPWWRMSEPILQLFEVGNFVESAQ